jgi:adenylate cyclase
MANSTQIRVEDGTASRSERAWVRLLAGGRARPFGATVLAVLLALSLMPGLTLLTDLRLALFDTYQDLAPRQRASAPAVIVAIDEASLNEIGQWPWPRNVMARLIEAIGKAKLVAEADPGLARRLAGLRSNDQLLADALRANPVVLGMAGLDQLVGGTPALYPRSVPFRVSGGDPSSFLRHFLSVLRSIDMLDAAAAGHALLSVDTHAGIVRQVPLVAMIGPTLTPALSVEMLRIASDVPAYSLKVDLNGVQGIGVGDLLIPTAPDGSVWLHFSERDMDRFISAATVLSGKADPRYFEDKLVLVGVTGLGLLDYQATPIGERMPGIEVHAQLLEAIFDNTLLHRPGYMVHIERALVLLCGAILILAVPAARPRVAALIFVAVIAGLLATGFALYHWHLLLLDVAWPAVAVTLLFGVMLSATLAAGSDRNRKISRWRPLRFFQARRRQAVLHGR